MWPWEHLALGYLLLSLTWRLWGRDVDGWAAASLALGTQAPDVDKALAWLVGVLPAGRSLLHSVFALAVVTAVVLVVAAHRERLAAGAAFVLGYASHLFGDALPKLLAGNYEGLTFLLWPVLPLPPYDGFESVKGSLFELAASPETYLTTASYRTLILFGVVVVWMDDGFPGVAGVGRYLRRTLFHR